MRARQRGGAAPAARRLRRDGAGAGADLPRRALQRGALDATALDLRRAPGAQGDLGRRHARRRHLGVPDRVEAADVLEPDVLGRGRSHGDRRRAPSPRAARPSSRDAAERIRSEIVAERLESARTARSSPPTAASRSTRRCSRWRSLRFLPRDDARLRSTIDAIGRSLIKDGGCCATRSTTASGRRRWPSCICTFWLVAGAGDGRPRRRGARGVREGPRA